MSDPRVSFARQSDIIDPAITSKSHVTICGLGTVGSNVAVELARLGIGSLHLVDFDVVEAHNLPSQRFGLADLDKLKTEATQGQVEAVSDCIVTTSNEKLAGGEFFPDGPVLMAVDDREARKSILEQSLKYRANHPVVFDFGMGGNSMQIFAFDPSDDVALRSYAALSDDSMAAKPLPCGGRTVSYVGAIIGGIGANHIRKFLTGEKLPFLTQVNLETMQMLTN